MNKQKKTKKLKLTTVLLGSITLVIIGYIILTKSSFAPVSQKHVVLEEKKEIIQLNIQDNTYVGLNNKQIIKVTKDGIAAYDFDGEELWSDTLTLEANFIVVQRPPYIAVGNKQGKNIILFNEKGKQGEITCKNPILYFSVNKNGGTAVIENLGDSHGLSAYNSEGHVLGINAIVYPNDVGYPSVIELSPNSDILLASYINIDKPVLTSTLVAMKTQKPKEESKYDSLYGIEQKDNLIYEIEFVNDNVWVSIGDKGAAWYTLDGKKVAEKRNLFSQFNPYLYKTSKYGKGFFPVIVSDYLHQNAIHRENELLYFDGEGEKYFSLRLKNAASYFYADDKGVVIGQKKSFAGYNKIGKQLFEFTSAIDVSKVFYLQEIKKGFAVTKDRIILLGPKREGE